jgi:hypothetical protein
MCHARPKWIGLGRLRLIWCVGPRPGSLGHPNKWMIVWRRRLPEFGFFAYMTREEWFRLPLKVRQRWWRDHGYGPSSGTYSDAHSPLPDWWVPTQDIVERADEDEPEKVRLLQAYAPTACFECDHPDAPKARKEIVAIIRAIRQREALSRPSGIEGDLPINCCRCAKSTVQS